jgi:MFS family permease
VLGALVGGVGSWMLRTSQLVLVIDVSDANGLIVGITTAAQYVPILLFSAFVGVAADRRSKATLLLTGQAVMVVASFGQMALLLAGVDHWTTIAAFAALFGVGAAIDGPMRTAVVPELVPPDEVSRAVSFNVVLLQIGRLIGPVLAAFLIVGASSYAVAFGVAGAFVLVFLLILPRLSVPPDPAVRERAGGVRDAVSYLRRNRRIVIVFILVGVGGLVGPNLITLSGLMVTRVFDGGPTEIAWASTALAVGAMLGALWAARTRWSSIRTLAVITALVGATSALSALAPELFSYLAVLALAGAVAISMVSRGTALVQELVDDEMRGRVTGLYFIILIVGAPIGSPIIGGLADLIGVRAAMLGAGLAVLAAAITLDIVARRRART